MNHFCSQDKNTLRRPTIQVRLGTYAENKTIIYETHLPGADKSLARPTSLSIVFSAQGTGGSSTGPDPENRVGDQDTGSLGRPVSSGLQVPREPFPSWLG
jgi:hypothetical protein